MLLNIALGLQKRTLSGPDLGAWAQPLGWGVWTYQNLDGTPYFLHSLSLIHI